MYEFTAWPKTPRLFRDIVVTEKIDGTNAAIHFDELGEITTQSRKRIVSPNNDNYGFGRWAHENAAELFALLGSGLHFGEWWGSGIQRRYDMSHKGFSLFNTDKHRDVNKFVGGALVQPVPVLYHGPFSEEKIVECLVGLRDDGSEASPGFMNPEGVCVYHTSTRSVFKVTLDNNDAGKWEA
ncbi:RNA ligase family protein [Streptomyces nigrescens]